MVLTRHRKMSSMSFWPEKNRQLHRSARKEPETRNNDWPTSSPWHTDAIWSRRKNNYTATSQTTIKHINERQWEPKNRRKTPRKGQERGKRQLAQQKSLANFQISISPFETMRSRFQMSHAIHYINIDLLFDCYLNLQDLAQEKLPVAFDHHCLVADQGFVLSMEGLACCYYITKCLWSFLLLIQTNIFR